MSPRGSAVSPQNTLVMLGGMCLLIAILYWAQTVFIPLALAILLSFALTPVVSYLQRHRLRRLWAVVVVVLLTLLLAGGIVAILSAEIRQIAEDLSKPDYKNNLSHKLNYFQGGKTGAFDRLDRMIKDLSAQFESQNPEPPAEEEQLPPASSNPEAPKPDAHKPRIRQPIPVRVVPTSSTGWTLLPQVALPIGAALGRISLIAALTISMLLNREDLRNRLIHLAGAGRMTTTTRAIEEATQRISSYLLVQVSFNLCFGVVFALGLACLSVPYSLLWGILAAILRFIPYIGTWMAAAVPALLSLAVFDDWLRPFLVLGLVVGLGMAANYLIEPRLVSRSSGVSPFALVVSAAFWTWLWGLTGLVLAAPITACLGVLGKHVPQLHFLRVLLGTESTLGPQFSYYQRLLARDEAEAAELVETYLEAHPLEELFDEVLLPTLAQTRIDRERDELGDREVDYIVQSTRELLENLPEKAEEQASKAEGQTSAETPVGAEADLEVPSILVLGLPARDEVDELALRLFQLAMKTTKARFEMVGSKTVSAEMVQQVAKEQPAVVVIAAVPPVGLAQTRYLCKRLRARFPRLTILVGCWGDPEEAKLWAEPLQAAGATASALTLRESLAQVVPYLSVAPRDELPDPFLRSPSFRSG